MVPHEHRRRVGPRLCDWAASTGLPTEASALVGWSDASIQDGRTRLLLLHRPARYHFFRDPGHCRGTTVGDRDPFPRIMQTGVGSINMKCVHGMGGIDTVTLSMLAMAFLTAVCLVAVEPCRFASCVGDADPTD